MDTMRDGKMIEKTNGGQDWLARAAAHQDRLVQDRRYLHAHAETGFDLHHTAAYVRSRLEAMGLQPRECGRCGLVAEIGTGERCVLLRADMDALPIREEAEVPFACPDGRMHACGHDLHTAMLLGAAALLKDREAELQGRVRLMFQPAEETLQGAQTMVDAGVLTNPEPAAAFMLHVLTGGELPTGTVIVSSPGVSAPGAATFRITVQGRGCHGAMPHTGVDPVLPAAATVLGIQQIQTRELGWKEPCALTIGMLRAGDTANVIPDQAVIEGSTRAFDNDTKAFILRRVGEMARGTAALGGASAEMEVLSDCPPLVNDAALSDRAARCLREALGAERVLISGELGGRDARASGSEDFAVISQRTPSVMAALAAGRQADGHDQPTHHPRVTFDEDALSWGAAAYAAFAWDVLQNS